MDAGEYETNTLVINNISSVAYRIYEPVVTQSTNYTFAASDVENALRKDGHLVYMDSRRRGIWCFRLLGKDGASMGLSTLPNLESVVDVCGYKIGLADEGAFEPISLLRGRPAGGMQNNTPNSSSSSTSALDMSVRSAQSYSLPAAQMSSQGASEPGTQSAAQLGSVVQEAGKGYKSVPPKEVYEYFVSSILSSLATSFCTRTGAIPLNSKSFLFPRDANSSDNGGETNEHATLATLRIYLVTTGSLIISLCHSVVRGLAPMGQAIGLGLLSPGTPVLAAPFGTFASFHSVVEGDYPTVDGGLGLSPDTQISKYRQHAPDGKLQQWRLACTKILESRGVRSIQLQKAAWFNIQYLKQAPGDQKIDGKRTPVNVAPTAILWPSALCFWKSKQFAWTNELRSLEGGSTYDLLSPARSWLVDSEDRTELLAKRTRERDADNVRDPGDADIRAPQGSGYSPLALRASNNIVPGAMYPTPPDAVQNPVGVTPTFDGNVSSPGNPATAAAVVDVDTTMSTAAPVKDPFGDDWEGGETKRERHDESHIGDGDENIFGELGTDMFGDTDVTDADFNFFDEEGEGRDGMVFESALDNLVESPADTHSISHPEPEGLKKEPEEAQMAAPAIAPTPMFTKPELKHARSSLADDLNQSQADHPKRPKASGIKRQPSPFSAETVFKRVKASLDTPAPRVSTRRAPVRRGSVFGTVDFSPFLSFNNKKYQENGRFEYHAPPQQENETPTSTRLPKIEKSQTKRTGTGDLKDLPSRMGALIASITGGIENASLLGDPGRYDDMGSDEGSLVSDQDDDSSDEGAEPFSPIKSAIIRRRADDDSISVVQSLRDFDGTAVASPQLGLEFCKIPTSDVGEVLAAKYFAEPEAPSVHLSLNDEDLITIAQIITEQAVSGSLRSTPPEPPMQYQGLQSERRVLSNRVRQSMDALEAALPASLGDAVIAQFKPLIEVQDVPLLGQPSRMPARPPGATEQLRPNLFQIPAPHLEVQRNEVNLSVVPSAVTFWEVLGLGPARGVKDVQSVCVYPNFDGLVDAANSFLDRMRIVYESLRLGSHNRLATTSSVTEGLLQYEVDECAQSPSVLSLATNARSNSGVVAPMSKLAQALASASQTASEKNFVIYFIYLPSSPSSIVDCCSAFNRLFDLYRRLLTKNAAPNDLVLQLIPIDLLASSASLVLPTAPDYIKFCLEAYDRCTLFGGAMPSPAIVLEQPLPRLLDFKLTTSPSQNLLHENSCLHIAYAISNDDRWVTAAWTDNRGAKQMTASYCLGRKGKTPTTPIADIAREIWDTTHDLISMWKVHWRVIITKCGPMEQDEIDIWVELGKAETKASISLTLLTVDTHPSLQLVPPAAKVPLTASSVFYTTPVSTPQPAVMSPDQSGNPPSTPHMAHSAIPTTPGGAGGADNTALEPDGDTSLVDVTETTWGAVVSHRLNNSSSLADLNSALASGYLVKRGGTRAEDPPAVLEVNVIHSEGNPRVYETLIREMLMYFRQLGTLARARGVVDRETDVRPWHVAAAEKGVKALYQFM